MATPAARLVEIETVTHQRDTVDARLRELIADAVAAGVPVAAVARAAGVTRQTAYRWVQAIHAD